MFVENLFLLVYANMPYIAQQRNLTPAYVNDGLIELVGFRDGWHGLALLTPNGHGTRLAQVSYFVFWHC